MSDTSPKDQSALFYGAKTPAPRQAQPGELLFEFHVPATHRFYRCELRDRGVYGVEAQLLDPVELVIAHVFPSRELAVQWATLEREALEHSAP